MLEEFTVDNFKSLVNVTFRPREQSLLLGVNNSGKTNLCQALRFLSATARLKLDECAEQTAGGWFSLKNHYTQKPTIEFQVKASFPSGVGTHCYEYHLSISVGSSAPGSPKLGVEKETLRVVASGPEGVPSRLASLENVRGSVSVEETIGYPSTGTHGMQMTVPPDATMLSRVFESDMQQHISRFKDYLCSWQYYELWTPELRKPAHGLSQPLLNTHGSNLASAVHRLKTTDERSYRQLVRQLRTIDPTIDVINFDVGAGETTFMYFEDHRGNAVSAENASSGTLRFLAMLCVFHAQPASTLSPLIMIEEPENGIYVGFLKELLEMAKDAPPRPQLIFTSHSPYFIDLFDDRLDSIFLLKPGQQQSSIVQPDVDKVKKRLETFPLGEQHFREMLG